MPSTPKSSVSSTLRLSTDTWAVILSLSLALLIRIGLIKSVPW
jgi:hypothetical protein